VQTDDVARIGRPFRAPILIASFLMVVVPVSLQQALKQLDAALGQLEAAAQRKLELERRRGDLETELAIMQDDRARLATDLDGAMTRLKAVEGAASDAMARLDRAMLAIQAAMSQQAALEGVE
jgi:predicted  nucleic acid-binding Zn-ribbon protein